MDSPGKSFIGAAAQATPVFLNRDATIAKAGRLSVEAVQRGALLLAFPESFVPAYPDWVWAVPPGDEGLLNEAYAELLENSVEIPSRATDQICEAAAQARVNVILGISERNVEDAL